MPELDATIIGASGGVTALQTASISVAPSSPLAESAYDVSLGNGPLRQAKLTISGSATAGTPGSGGNAEATYRNAVDLTPDYLCLVNSSGWNSSAGSNAGRTGIYASRRKLVHNGQGDLIAYNASVRITSTYSGATHWLASPAGVIINGTVVGEAQGAYLNPFELLLKDSTGSTATFTADTTSGSAILTNIVGALQVGDVVSGPGMATGSSRVFVASISGNTATLVREVNYAEVPALATATATAVTLTRVVSNRVACAALVCNMERNRSTEPSATNGGTGIGEPWWGLRVQARGTVPIDSVVSAIGKAFVGIDFSAPYLSFQNNAAIALKAGMRRYFNATGFEQDDSTVFIRDNTRMTGGFTDYDVYDSAISSYKVVIGGNETLRVSGSQVTVTKLGSGNISVDGTQNKIFINGQTIIGPRKTGWGNWTGTANRSGKATYSAGSGLSFGATYSQAEHTALAARVAALEAALQDASQTIKALIDDLSIAGGSHGIIGA